MVRTRVGYAGGTHPDPTYHDMGDHTEAFQLDFDPRVISYRDLLDAFWHSHRCDRGGGSRQYMAAVFCETDDHARRALASRPPQARTPVVAGARFYLAEDYHQKYYLRHASALMREVAHYTPAELRESTVAARLNAFAAGHGTARLIDEQLASYGLSPAGNAALAKLVRER